MKCLVAHDKHFPEVHLKSEHFTPDYHSMLVSHTLCMCWCLALSLLLVCFAGWWKTLPGTRFLWRTLWWGSPLPTTSCTSSWTRASRSASCRWSATRRASCTRSRTSAGGASSTCTTTSPPTVWRCSQGAWSTWPKVSVCHQVFICCCFRQGEDTTQGYSDSLNARGGKVASKM